MKKDTLPLLKSSFFNNLDPSTLKHLLSANKVWSKDILPVASWQGKLIIAVSSENIEVPKLDSPYLLVKTNSENLKKLFQELFSDNKKESAQPLENINFPSLPEENISKADIENMPLISDNSNTGDMPDMSDIENNETTNVLDFSLLNNKSSTKKNSNLLEEFSKIFSQVMILQVEDNILLAKESFGPWQKDDFSAKEVDLEQNSIFKIPFKSLEPYHGYISPNPTNMAFFQSFNGGKVPNHISIFPIIENKKCQALIVGICSAEKAKELNLEELKQMANKDFKSTQKVA